MTYQEKNITISLTINVLILGIFGVNLFQMVQEGSFNSTNLFSLWGTVIVITIFATILGTILTMIVSSIIHTIKTNEEETFIEDERDKLIDLKGSKNSYNLFSLGVFISMITLVMDKSPLVMFSLLIFSGIMAQIFGEVSRLYFYRRGF